MELPVKREVQDGDVYNGKAWCILFRGGSDAPGRISAYGREFPRSDYRSQGRSRQRNRCAGGWMLLVRGGGVPADRGRGESGVRIFGRRRFDRALRYGEHGDDGARGIRAGDFRSAEDFLRADPEGVFRRGARSDAVEPAGAGSWDAVSVGGFLFEPGAEEDRRGVHQAAGRGEGISRADRDAGGAAEGVLSGRGTSPELLQPESAQSLCAGDRDAEGGEGEAESSGAGEVAAPKQRAT